MATSSEKDDDRDEKDDTGEDDAEESESSAAKDNDDDKPVKAAPKLEGKAPAKRMGPKAGRVRPAPPQQNRSLGKSMLLFIVIIGGVAGGFALLGGGDQGGAPARPKWKTGDSVDVEITLKADDRTELGCSSSDELAGKHCAFEAMSKAWSKGDNNDDKKLLKPYTTAENHIQFVAAGLWSEPALAADKLPAKRFTVKCKYKVEGTLKNLAVRWEATGQWYPQTDWYAGAVSDCKLSP